MFISGCFFPTLLIDCVEMSLQLFCFLFNPSSKAARISRSPGLSWWLMRIWPTAQNWNGFSSLRPHLENKNTCQSNYMNVTSSLMRKEHKYVETESDISPFLRNGDLLMSMYWFGIRLKFDMGFSFMLLKEQCSAIFWMTSSLRLRPRKSDSLLRAAGRS